MQTILDSMELLLRAAPFQVLMCAGRGGATTQEIVDRANEAKLTQDQPWDKNKKTVITQTIRMSKFHGHIGHLRYAHFAFPGAGSSQVYLPIQKD